MEVNVWSLSFKKKFAADKLILLSYANKWLFLMSDTKRLISICHYFVFIKLSIFTFKHCFSHRSLNHLKRCLFLRNAAGNVWLLWRKKWFTQKNTPRINYVMFLCRVYFVQWDTKRVSKRAAGKRSISEYAWIHSATPLVTHSAKWEKTRWSKSKWLLVFYIRHSCSRSSRVCSR